MLGPNLLQQPLYDQNGRRLGSQEYGMNIGPPQQTPLPVLSQTSQLSTLQDKDLSSVINPIRPGVNASGGGLTLAGMVQQPMQNPIGGGLSSLNQQPFGMAQQPQQMNGGLKGLLDSYIGNYINNYFMNALR